MSWKTRLLVVAPAARPRSYARVAESMLGPLRERYDIHQFVIGHGDRGGHHPWPLHANQNPGDAYGARSLAEVIERLRPDLLLIVFDAWLYFVYAGLLKERFPGLQTILYCPIDGDDAEPRYIAGLRRLDQLVVFTNFARRVVREAAARIAGGDVFPPVDVIPHGVDLTRFHPGACRGDQPLDLGSVRRDARRVLFSDRPELEGSFIVLNANQNNPRKRVDLTLEAFAKFANNKPDSVKLYLHMNIHETGCDLLPIARRLGIDHRLLWTGAPGRIEIVSDDRLNVIYRACDVGVNSSIGEGWGLVAFEHGATGAAQVLPRNSVHEELWEGVADLVETVARPRGNHEFVSYRTIDTSGLAAALDRLYGSSSHLQRRSQQALQRASDRSLSWLAIAEQWDLLFRRVLDRHGTIRHKGSSDEAC